MASVLAEKTANFASLVKLSHTVFALPFALSMAVVCGQLVPVTPAQILGILVAMVAARSAAMGFNRLVDAEIDARNPRTAVREIPAGIVSVHEARGFVLIASGVFLFAAAALGRHCLYLAPLVLGWLFLYSYCKRFTRLSHLVLGAALAMAPGGVWYALVGDFAWAPVPLMVGVALWVAGFDIIYASQDFEFDRAAGLHSIPARFGISKALIVSKIFHLFAALSFAVFGLIFDLGVFFWIGFAVFLGLIASQHRLVSPNDLSRADAAFFTRNGIASVVFFIGVAGAAWL